MSNDKWKVLIFGVGTPRISQTIGGQSVTVESITKNGKISTTLYHDRRLSADMFVTTLERSSDRKVIELARGRVGETIKVVKRLHDLIDNK